jgi:TonB-dependent receptor-like protein
MNAAEIAHRSGIYLGDVLRMAPGIMASYTPRGRIFTMRSNWGGDRCSPTYYLDGMRWYALDQNPILELERYIQLHDLAAVEVYAGGASTPAQFDGGNGCGAVVFWTKQ